MIQRLKSFIQGKRGIGLVEYAIIIGIVLAVALAGGSILGSNAKTVTNNLGSDLSSLKIYTTNTASGGSAAPTAGQFTVNTVNIQ